MRNDKTFETVLTFVFTNKQDCIVIFVVRIWPTTTTTAEGSEEKPTVAILNFI